MKSQGQEFVVLHLKSHHISSWHRYCTHTIREAIRGAHA